MISPTHPPITTEITNPTNKRQSETAMLSIKIFSCTKSTKDWATIAGEGRETTGQMCKENTICQIIRNTNKNEIMLKTSFKLNLIFFFKFINESMAETLTDYSSHGSMLLSNSIVIGSPYYTDFKCVDRNGNINGFYSDCSINFDPLNK